MRSSFDSNLLAAATHHIDMKRDFESPKLCEAFLSGRCRKGERCWMVHEKEDEANPGKMKRFKSRADEPREGTLVPGVGRPTPGPNPRWVPRESPTELLRKWLLDVGSPLVLRQALRVGPHRGDWDLEFDESPECSWSVTASSTARAGAVVLGRRQFHAATDVEIPGSNLTGEANIGILVHGTDSEAALNILEVGRLRNGSAEPIGVFGCAVEKPSAMHIAYGAKIFYQVCAFPLTKNSAKAYARGPYPPGTIAHNPYNRSADEWICDASSTKVTRIILDFRTAFVKLTAWDATKQKTKPVPKEAFDEFCPERAEPKAKAQAKAKGSVVAFMTG